MKILNGVSNYAVYETNFEAARLVLNFLGENILGGVFSRHRRDCVPHRRYLPVRADLYPFYECGAADKTLWVRL